MSKIISAAVGAQKLLNKTRRADFLAPLLIRLFLFPVFWMAGTMKISNFDYMVGSFTDLGIPFPAFMLVLVILAEFVGSMFLLAGLATRWAAIPLLITMLVAMITTHAQNGWLANADPYACLFNCEKYEQAQARKDKAKEILRKYGKYDWLTARGEFTILNNGIEFAATYFIMLLVLFFTGAGRVSIDNFLARRCMRKGSREKPEMNMKLKLFYIVCASYAATWIIVKVINVWGLTGEALDKALDYSSPSFGGILMVFTLIAALFAIPGENITGNDNPENE